MISKSPTVPRQPHPALGSVGSGLGPARSGQAPVQTSDQPLQIDVRLLRQMGYTPYSVSTRPAKRKLDPVLLQQRRLQRRIRLTHVESPKVTEPLPMKLPAAIEKQVIYSDSHGNSYFYWDESSHVGKGSLPFQREGAEQ